MSLAISPALVTPLEETSFADYLSQSIARQEAVFDSSLILNPVENIPFRQDIAHASGFMHGLYNTDKIRSNEQKFGTFHQFAGRDRIAYDTRTIYTQWAKQLKAADVSMRLLSGLHAHTVMFMALAEPGQKVLLLPEIAGGHMSTKAILERLGLEVIDMAVDYEGQCIDIPATLQLIDEHQPDFLFSDRSEGLTYEEFHILTDHFTGVSVFDGSQYLSNILAGDHANPFDMGFDIFISTLHKNFPGPQKALVATAEKSEPWKRLLSGISTYVSNMHNYGTYAAGFGLERKAWLYRYSSLILENAITLEDHLYERGVYVVRRRRDASPTHHLWLKAPTRELAFKHFKDLEFCRLLTNYRKLPYQLGFGLRLGLNASTRSGLRPENTPELAELISEIVKKGASLPLRQACRRFIKRINQRAEWKADLSQGF